jgi:gamma-glutamylcyclotransferase (GGCT)/AIG2-like uncharacterized protein YtfP
MRFFMIGSWTEGMFHFQKLMPFIVSYEPATIQATAYRLPVGFPVIIEDQTATIHGQFIELKDDSTLLALMDTLQGVKATEPAKGLHYRKQTTVTKASGQTDTAEVYFYNPKKLTAKAAVIADGLWKQSLEDQQPLPMQLSERQKTYVLKLGAVKGRDIVPINDLSLYRELMKLELIVDKGRRLALSSLGKEVYNHLV